MINWKNRRIGRGQVSRPGLEVLEGRALLSGDLPAGGGPITDGDADPISAFKVDIFAFERQALNDVLVASFSVAPSPGPTANYAATIDWGDRTSSVASVTENGQGGFSVRASHTYINDFVYTPRITIRNVVSGVTTSVNSTATIVQVNSPADAARSVSDFDGEGKSDRAIFRPLTGEWYSLGSTSGAVSVVGFGAPNNFDIPVPADFDGDGLTDYSIFRPSTGQWIILQSATGVVRVSEFGARNLFDVPVPSDYDGDGKADLAIFRPSTGEWIILNSGNGSVRVQAFGAQNLFDLPVVGDYDNDNRADLAVFRPSIGQWIILQSASGSVRLVNFGARNLFDLPVVGDYDGDGRSDIGVFRPLTAEWITLNSSNGAVQVQAFGAQNLFDLPVSPVIGGLVARGLFNPSSPRGFGDAAGSVALASASASSAGLPGDDLNGLIIPLPGQLTRDDQAVPAAPNYGPKIAVPQGPLGLEFLRRAYVLG